MANPKRKNPPATKKQEPSKKQAFAEAPGAAIGSRKFECIMLKTKIRKNCAVLADCEEALDFAQWRWGDCFGSEAENPMALVQWCQFNLKWMEDEEDDRPLSICWNALNQKQESWGTFVPNVERLTQRTLQQWCAHLPAMEDETLEAIKKVDETKDKLMELGWDFDNQCSC